MKNTGHRWPGRVLSISLTRISGQGTLRIHVLRDLNQTQEESQQRSGPSLLSLDPAKHMASDRTMLPGARVAIFMKQDSS